MTSTKSSDLNQQPLRNKVNKQTSSFINTTMSRTAAELSNSRVQSLVFKQEQLIKELKQRD
jgi:hypothetical protein